MLQTRKAVTLMEILIVVVLVGIVAAFGIPSYTKSIERADAREAADNLRMIASAMELYRAQEGGYPVALSGVVNINTVLNLNIIEQNMNYSCATTGGYTCTAASPSGWKMEIVAGNTDPSCSVGTCPPFP